LQFTAHFGGPVLQNPEPSARLAVFSPFDLTGYRMMILEHPESHIVKLDDGSTWQIFLGRHLWK
jgi:hypothetical protein